MAPQVQKANSYSPAPTNSTSVSPALKPQETTSKGPILGRLPLAQAAQSWTPPPSGYPVGGSLSVRGSNPSSLGGSTAVVMPNGGLFAKQCHRSPPSFSTSATGGYSKGISAPSSRGIGVFPSVSGMPGVQYGSRMRVA